MKTSLPTEATDTFEYAFFDATDFGPIATYADVAVSSTAISNANEVFLDRILAAIKWIFLYIPGAAAVHMLMLGFALMFHYQDWASELQMIGGLTGTGVILMFMIMLGIGKLQDLRYLRVVAAVYAATAVMALVYGILIAFMPGDFFGFYAKLTLPLTLWAGYLVKINTDRRTNGSATRSETDCQLS
ncbi:hypothetical protein BH10ACI2_BH10ACI2_16200 [soil metagenome]